MGKSVDRRKRPIRPIKIPPSPFDIMLKAKKIPQYSAAQWHESLQHLNSINTVINVY